MGITNWTSEHHSFGYVVALMLWHSVGLAVGNIVASGLLQQVTPKVALVCALTITGICGVVLSLLQDPGVVLIALLRFVEGCAAAVPLVYLPLWVDEFASSDGYWMSVLQIGVSLGHFFGTLCGASTAQWAATGWRASLLVQTCIITPLIGRVVTSPQVQVDVPTRIQTARMDCLTLQGAESSGLQNLLREMRDMIQGMNRNPLTLSLSSTLCILHAIGALLLLWSAPYLFLSADAPSGLWTQILSALVFSSLPSLGCYVGAICCSRMQGFKAGMHATALRISCAFAVLAAMCGPLNSAAEGFLARFLLLCLWLFCCGCLLPILCALLMTSMPSYLRSFNATSMFLMLHLLSFSVAPLLVTLLMGCFLRPEKALNFGVALAFWATTPAAILLIFTYAREPKSSGPSSLSGVDDLSISDVSYELARRRISTVPL
ncbi:unnamed protein product [Cladocopium goreaui]|uniref:Major facilitator superfamily (MFS) profile domain-containing protein n=1 Tax=Cladocopium goreaui TaxID=2562237 RepID=A0A9P1GG98_9DINO|nr:unnamed protein product [Cladocopium goreaui]